ncbi:MAG: Gfo/Idh/MocA family oxidoreductase, partial [Clostridiales bacterium]|nr:Gfo/Idh/MocA family oxidoreductase [Clostridiales bacterium]
EGLIGDIVSGYARFSCWYPDIPGSWRQTKATGGGGSLMDMGVHCIDLFEYITGSRVKQIAAFHDTLTFNYEVEDSSTVLLRLENGAQCVVQTNFNIPDDASKWRLELFGTRGRLVGDNVVGQDDGGTLDSIFLEEVGGYDAAQETKDTVSSNAYDDVEFGNTFTREIESFSDSILKGNPLEAPASDGLRIQRIVEAAYRSNDKKIIIDF